MGSFIIDDTTSIDINTSITARRFVEEFAFERIWRTLGNIIVWENNDIICFVSLLEKGLISMTDIRLMSVIAESFGTSNKHCVVCSEGSWKNSDKGDKNQFVHLFTIFDVYLFLFIVEITVL